MHMLRPKHSRATVAHPSSVGKQLRMLPSCEVKAALLSGEAFSDSNRGQGEASSLLLGRRSNNLRLP